MSKKKGKKKGEKVEISVYGNGQYVGSASEENAFSEESSTKSEKL